MKNNQEGKSKHIGESAELRRKIKQLQDIIENQKNNEADLQQSLDKYRFLTEKMHDLIWILDADLRTLYVSPSIEMVLGFTQEERLAQSLESMMTPRSYEMVMKRFVKEMQLERDGKVDLERTLIVEVEFYHKNGSVVLMENLITAIRDEHGMIAGIHGVSRDITDRKAIENALRESEEKYRLVVENAGEAIFIAQDDRLVFVNAPTTNMIGYSKKELCAKPFTSFIHPEDLQKTVERYMRRLSGQEVPYNYQFRVIAKDGSIKWAEVHAVFTTWQGKPATLNFVIDVTEKRQEEEKRRQLEERLQRAEKMEALGILAGGVAHDLNNVLGIVVGYSEIMMNKLGPASPVRLFAENIMKGGERASAIVQDLLTLARRGVKTQEVINLNDVITDYRAMPEFEKLRSFHPNVEMTFILDRDRLNLLGSPTHIGKLFFNLVSNAVEAMPDGGHLTIRTYNQYVDRSIQGYENIIEGDYIVLSVSDTGKGIANNDLKRIFEPFYTKKVMGRSGTGLGLAVVWGTVKDHNGYVDVRSEKDKGSTFTIYFPVTRKKPSREQPVLSKSEYTGHGESVLVIDDVKEQRELASLMLSNLHYNVTMAASGEEAIGYLKKHKADILILDMIMDPGMDGLDTYRSICKLRSKQKAIIVSGYSETDRVREAQRLGAGAYVRKPYIQERLGLAIRKELDRKR